MEQFRPDENASKKPSVLDSDRERVQRLENELAEWKAKYDQLSRYAPAGIYEIDFKTFAFDRVNDVMCLHTGYSKQELMSMDPRNLLTEESRMAFIERYRRMLVGEKVPGTTEFQIVCKNGALLWAEFNIRIKYQYGLPVGAMVVCKDISQQKSAEAALQRAYDALEEKVAQRTAELLNANQQLAQQVEECRRSDQALLQSERRYRNLVENLPDIIFSTDRSGLLTHIHLPAESGFDYRESGLIGKPLTTLIYSKDLKMVESYFRDGIDHRIKVIRGLQFRIVAKDGTVHWVEANLRRQFDNAASFTGIDGILRDISETKTLVDQLIRSERLAATGQLANSVAHEINVPLQRLIGRIEEIEKKVPERADIQAQLHAIRSDSAAIHETVETLMALNRPGHDRRRPVPVNPIIESTVSLSRAYLAQNRATVLLNLDDDLPHVLASPQQISQVLMSLFNNAIEAINGLSTTDGVSDDAFKGGAITIRSYYKSGHVVIQVRDSGPGIDASNMERIFDPGFTCKKEIGIGTGLSICHGIIQDHGGILTAGNSPEGGAEFLIRLPAVK